MGICNQRYFYSIPVLFKVWLEDQYQPTLFLVCDDIGTEIVTKYLGLLQLFDIAVHLSNFKLQPVSQK